MISICIPVYNYKVSHLVEALLLQINFLQADAEIILIDDASQDSFRIKNSALINSVKYIQLEENIGRSRIRNLFLNHARYKYLLFLDCDSFIISADYIAKYFDVIRDKSPEIVCGGRVYGQNKPEKDKMLRWKYGHQRESLSAEQRNEKPNASFMTNNFLIQKEILFKHRFEGSLRGYGHEDTLFGYKLMKNHINIQHIENTILNGDLEGNEEFLTKTEIALQNLVKILKLLNNDKEFIESVLLLRWYSQLSKWKLIFVFDLIFRLIKYPLKKFCILRKSNMTAFSFYKLGYLITILRNSGK
jgi:glycosyltransferase involved in cell wall biosynthesis